MFACNRQVGLRRWTVKLDEVKRQGELVAEVGKARAGREEPGCNCGYGSEHDGEA